MLPFERDTDALDAALDEVRLRFGSAAVTRAVLLGRDRASVPLLPDYDLQSERMFALL